MHCGVAQRNRLVVPKQIPAGSVVGQVRIPLIGHLITIRHITEGPIAVGRIMEDLMVADTMVVLTAEDLMGVEGIIEAGSVTE